MTAGSHKRKYTKNYILEEKSIPHNKPTNRLKIWLKTVNMSTYWKCGQLHPQAVFISRGR